MSLRQGPLLNDVPMTLPQLLQRQGYATAMVGKWHLGFDPFLQDKDNPADYSKPLNGGPVDQGFDSFYGMHASLDLPPYFFIRDRRPVLPPTQNVEANSSEGGPDNWTRIQGAFWRKGKKSSDLLFDQVTPRFFEEAENVIVAHSEKNEEKPLFLYLALPSPHTPWMPLPEFQGKSKAGMYGDFVMQVDAGVGRILEALDRAAMTENTLVLFSSDNGPVWYDKDVERFEHRAVGNLRGMKFSSWEGGHRMPFLIRWPNQISAGQSCENTVVFSDLFATFAELTNAGNLPEDVAEDSVSFLSSLTEQGTKSTKRPPIIHNKQTIRDGEWKLILPKKQNKRNQRQEKAELYNLELDLAEQNNLIDQEPEIANRLRRSLTEFIAGLPGK